MIAHSKPCLGLEEQEAAARVLGSGMLAQGSQVAAFEAEMAALTGRAHAVAFSSGTAALHAALLAVGMGPGQQVAMPSYVCAALLQAVNYTGATAQLVDVGEDGNLRAEAVPAGTDAVIVPHLFGKPAVLPAHPCIIEDTAQSIGGPTGGQGIMTITSFYATKLLTSAGEGGMAFTNSLALAEDLRDRRDYDNRDDFRPRFAYKMTEVQAAVGRVQAGRLTDFLARRRELAARYSEAFRGLPMALPGGEGHVYFRYTVGVPDAAALGVQLAAAGIDAKRPVFRPLHHYTGGAFPGAERAHRELLSLPLYPALTDAEATCVIEAMRRYCGA
jgi:perosamine synthetase